MASCSLDESISPQLSLPLVDWHRKYVVLDKLTWNDKSLGWILFLLEALGLVGNVAHDEHLLIRWEVLDALADLAIDKPSMPFEIDANHHVVQCLENLVDPKEWLINDENPLLSTCLNQGFEREWFNNSWIGKI